MVIPPFAALIYFLFIKGSTPQASGLYASLVAIIFLCFQKEILKKFFKLIPALFVDTGKMMLEIGLVLGAAGIVVGVTGITGLGFNIGFILSTLAESGLLILLIMSAIFSVILGMGMPSVAAYALVAVLVAPTLVELGVTPLAAHLFVYFFAIVSNFTPPVAMSCFAAAPIAQANPHKIGFKAMQLGLVAYIVPFLFVYAPELLLSSESAASWQSTALTIVTALIACYLLSMAVEGFLFQRLNAFKRIVAVVLAFCLFLPYSVWEYSWIVNNAALLGTVLFIFSEWQFYRKAKATALTA
ncbi:TRAP transporter large permease subunit [Bacillus sp. Marseille-P3661]|uniref:TRAP transporter large permease subunit n=1 Tax=Bacillus sp. Marseille-P3661 TaxID=1936234 RepID=UPI000C850F88|nr:TRAP transporter large permease subunit [Bacillus sp. Marseille-P3661]